MAVLLLGGLGMSMIAPILVDIVMSAVPPRDAGAASGVTNTVSQIGTAAGLAVVGALFIAFLHGQAAPAVDAVTPQLRGDLATAGVPAAAQDELVAAFRRCALDRAEQQDPPSCQPHRPRTAHRSPPRRLSETRWRGPARRHAERCSTAPPRAPCGMRSAPSRSPSC
jgi:hypothetical protein